jgi:HPt (histidine-containing phosphotransfer) domain-containing protein
VEGNQGIKKSYDISQILSVSRGDKGFVKTMVKMFVVQTPLYIEKITKHFNDGNLSEMGEEAHKLKPSIYAMGMQELKKTISEIVTAGRENKPNEELKSHINKLNVFIAKVIVDLKADFNI